ncbi:hypothetical protein D3C83_319470 [compost metagenome]
MYASAATMISRITMAMTRVRVIGRSEAPDSFGPDAYGRKAANTLSELVIQDSWKTE